MEQNIRSQQIYSQIVHHYYYFFNQTITNGTKHFDYCVGYGDFLGRCKMPTKLIEDIHNAISYLEDVK